ncbi:MAG: N-acetylmuramoyl-L-alanine amidase [Dysgonamonadaceae bacterium]|jgi:N-acetylmuramoyl-L-alanine amidase|nr:N-acetylmuramoyl-L-alanine amidase [Dysgonamonadaceae bacterium]
MTLERIFFIVLLFFFLLASNRVQASSEGDSFVLVLDAGHGGKDTGAIGRKAREKDINLAITLLAGKYISEKYPDVEVLYTRKRDTFVGLNERADFANKSHASLFISIHTNSSEVSSPKGLEVYAFGVSRAAENLEVVKKENSVIYLEDNYKEKYEGFDPNSAESYIIFEFMQNKFVEQSLEFASIVRDELKSCTQWRDRGVKQAAFLVLREAGMPRILIELDFISNIAAENLMMSEAGQKKYAQAICNAFGKYKAAYDRKNNIKPAEQASQTRKEPENSSRPNTAQLPKDKEKKENPAGFRRVYKVQLLASRRPIRANSPELKGYGADYYVEDKWYKYTYGESESWEEISRIRQSLLKDFKGAFIVAFENGVKVQTK